MQIKRNLQYIAVILALALLGGFFGPQVYFSARLPSEASAMKAATTADAFNDWQLKSSQVIPSTADTPPAVFKCSVCYPDQVESKSCRERVSSWIARNLTADQGAQGNLAFHFKNYFLGKALLSKYSESTLYRMYLAFASRALQSSDLGEVCRQKFTKACSELSPEESIALEIDTRFGPNARALAGENLKSEVLKACAK